MSIFKYIKYMFTKGCICIFGKNRKKNHQISNEAIERIKIREYGRKINDYTRLKKKY